MSKIDEKVDALLAKHPNLSRPEATKIITDKNDRKRDRRAAKNDRVAEKRSQLPEKPPRTVAKTGPKGRVSKR